MCTLCAPDTPSAAGASSHRDTWRETSEGGESEEAGDEGSDGVGRDNDNATAAIVWERVKVRESRERHVWCEMSMICARAGVV